MSLLDSLKQNLYPGNTSNLIPENYKEEFNEEIVRVNYIRSRNISILLLIVLAALVVLDFDTYRRGLWLTIPGYRYLFYSHLVMWLGMFLNLVYSFFARLSSVNINVKRARLFIMAFGIITTISSALVSAADQLIHGGITVFILCVFALAITVYLKPIYSILIYAISYLVFLVGITYCQTNPEILRGHYINGTVLIILALFLSTILYYGKVRDFLSTKTIERQKIELETKNHELSATNRELHESLLALDESQNMIFTLTLTLESKDSNTHGHSDRVAEYVLALANHLGLNDMDKINLWRAAILHDIGKIGIPDAILNKTSRLTKEEWDIMKSHPERGESICSKLKFAREILPTIRHHHERFDGTGYPDGLKGEEIPYLARIISVADAVDAMTSPRSYRTPVTVEQAIQELQRCSGTQFDPHIVKAFLEIYNPRSA